MPLVSLGFIFVVQVQDFPLTLLIEMGVVVLSPLAKIRNAFELEDSDVVDGEPVLVFTSEKLTCPEGIAIFYSP